MKKSLLFLTILPAWVIFSCGPLFAQKDKVIVKEAKAMLERKASDSAFFHVLTVKKVKSGKVQDVLKKSYPALISKHMRETNNINNKIADKDDEQLKSTRIQQMIDIMNGSRMADSLLNLNVKADDYKQLSKKKSIDKSISSLEKRLEISRQNIIKLARAKRIKDSTAVADSIRQVYVEDSLRMAQDAALAHVNDSIAALSAKKTKTETPPAEKITKTNPGKGSNPPGNGKTRFYIIAGAFKTEEDAQRAADKLKDQGFGSEVVNVNPWGNYRICFNSYDTREAAINDLGNIRSKYRSDAWILAK